jgi:putative transcriptional regulator
MPTKKRSTVSSKASSKRADGNSKRTSLGKHIEEGLEEFAGHLRGEKKLRTRVIHVPDAVNVRTIREQTGLSQSEFADNYGFNPRTLQEWEQGRAKPDGAIRAYLTVISKNPAAVENALKKAS